MIINLRFPVWIISLIVSSTVFAQSISLDAYRAHIETHTHYVAIAQHTLAQYDTNIEAERRKSGWVLSGQSYWDRESPNPPNAVFMSRDPITQTGIETQLTKPIWSTGGAFGVSHALRRTDQNAPVIALGGTQQSLQANPLYTRSLGVSYRQPLLRNRWGTQSLLNYKLAQNHYEYQRIIQAESNESFQLDQHINYLRWAQYYATTQIMNDRLSVAVSLYTDTKAKHANNLIETLELLQSQQYLNQQKTDESRAHFLLKTHQNQLSTALNYPAIRTSTPSLDLYQIPDLNTKPVTQSFRVIDALVTQHSANTLMQNYHIDQHKPQLDLVLSTHWHDSINEHNRVTDYGLMDQQVRVEFSTPLGQRPVAATLTALQHESNQIQTTIEHEHHQLLAQKAFLESEYRRLRVQYEHQITTIALHSETVKEEQRLYEQGRRNLTFVLQSQDAEHAAKLALLETAYQLHCRVAQHNALLDRLR